MLAPTEEGTNPLVSSNTSSESDTTPSRTPSHSPSPARSIKSRFARQYRSKRAQSQQIQQENKSDSNTSSNSSTPTRIKKKKKANKTVLVFINSSKSKSTRSLFNLAKRKRNKNLKVSSIIKSKSSSILPTDPTSTIHKAYINNNMANVQQMKDQFEKGRRNSSGNNYGAANVSGNYNKQFTYFNNGGNGHHPSKINTEHFKRGYNKNLPQKPYIVDNDDDHNNHKVDASHFRRNHRKDKEPTSPNRHHKSKSHIGLSPSAMSASRSKSPVSRNGHHGHQYIGQTNGYHVNATHKYTGVCPHCNHEAPLLEYITASNRHSHLTELRDKLSAVETLASILKQQILQVQSRSGGGLGGGSDGNLHGKKSKNKDQKQVSNPFQEDQSKLQNSYHIQNLTIQQKQALSLLTEHKNITFPIKGTAMISPQENIGYFDKFKEMRRRFVNQEFFVGLDSDRAIFTVHTKMRSNGNSKDSSGKQYRQVRSFASLNGAEFESAKDNVLKIWFKNTRGYFLMSFASETEANTVLNLINIIVNNSKFSQQVSSQLVWASYVDKKGKRMRMYSQRFLCLIKLEIKLYKTHINYKNGEEPAQTINLMSCDLTRDKKEIKFIRKKVDGNDDNGQKQKAETILSIKLPSEIERDDFLNLCAQTLGKAIQKKAKQDKNGQLSSMMVGSSKFQPMSPSHTISYLPNSVMDPAFSGNGNNGNNWNLTQENEDSATDIEDSEFYPYNMEEEKSEYRQNESIGLDPDDFGYGGGGGLHDDLIFKSMTMTLRGPPTTMGNLKNKSAKHANYLEKLNNTPRMYGASSHKALDRLAKKRPSDIDFIETTFKGNEVVLKSSKNVDLKTYQLLDVLGKSMISGAFLNKSLYLHKAVWEQNKVMVINYEKKIETFKTMLDALNVLLADINIDWLKSDFETNSKSFHGKLVKCEKKLRDAQSTLTDFINRHQQKSREKGAAKFLAKFKDKSRVKVFDNQPYRDLIYKMCGHASSMQLYYIYLTKPSKNEDQRKMLLNDIKGITLCMASFARVVVADMREFVFAYLRRGSKNIYES